MEMETAYMVSVDLPPGVFVIRYKIGNKLFTDPQLPIIYENTSESYFHRLEIKSPNDLKKKANDYNQVKKNYEEYLQKQKKEESKEEDDYDVIDDEIRKSRLRKK